MIREIYLSEPFPSIPPGALRFAITHPTILSTVNLTSQPRSD